MNFGASVSAGAGMSVVPFTMVATSCFFLYWCQWHHMTKKVMLHLILISWPKESSGAIDDAFGITWPKESFCTSFWPSCLKQFNATIYEAVSIMWHQWKWHHIMKKSHVAHHFYCPTLRNSMTPFMTLSASHAVEANGVIWWKKSCCISFQLSWPKEFSGAFYSGAGIMWHQCQWCHMKKSCHTSIDWIDLRNSMVSFTMLSASHDTDSNDITWWKKSCCTSFQLSWPVDFNGATYNTIGITWHWCQWDHMTKSDGASHFNHLDLRNSVEQFTMPLASCDADTDANGIMWWENSCCTSHQLSWPKEFSGAI